MLDASNDKVGSNGNDNEREHSRAALSKVTNDQFKEALKYKNETQIAILLDSLSDKQATITKFWRESSSSSWQMKSSSYNVDFENAAILFKQIVRLSLELPDKSSEQTLYFIKTCIDKIEAYLNLCERWAEERKANHFNSGKRSHTYKRSHEIIEKQFEEIVDKFKRENKTIIELQPYLLSYFTKHYNKSYSERLLKIRFKQLCQEVKFDAAIKEIFATYNNINGSKRDFFDGLLEDLGAILMRFGAFEQLLTLCRWIIESKEISKKGNDDARFHIAHLIFLGYVDFYYESGPFAEGLACQNLPVLNKNAKQEEKQETIQSMQAILVARAVQAFEYVVENENNNAKWLKSRLTAILEGKYFELATSSGGKPWTQENLELFSRYYLAVNKVLEAKVTQAQAQFAVHDILSFADRERKTKGLIVFSA